MIGQSLIYRTVLVALIAGGILIAEDSICSAQADKHPQKTLDAQNYLESLKEARVEHIRLRLNVAEEKANAIAAKWTDLEAPIRKMHQEAMTLWRQIQFIIQEATPEKEKSRKIKPLFDQYVELRKQLSIGRQRLYQELPTMGDTPVQQARLLLLMEEMERKERDGLRAHLGRRKGRMGK